VFVKWVRKVFGPKKGEVTGEWRRLHNKEIYDLYLSLNIMWVIKSRIMRWAEHVARMGGRIRVYKVVVGKIEGKRPLGQTRRRLQDNIEMDEEAWT
jgi:hypothetical protein